MRGLILALCVGAAAAASAAPAAPTTSYGSCEKKDAAHDDGHAKDDGHSHAADDGHAGHRLLASAPPSDDDAPIKCNVKEDDCDGHWYPPGYVSNTTGCCHCEASCDHDAEWAGDHADDHHRRLAEDDERYRRFLASESADEDHGACGYYDASGGHGGHHFEVTYGNCHHACHDCELNACSRFWLEQNSAGTDSA